MPWECWLLLLQEMWEPLPDPAAKGTVSFGVIFEILEALGSPVGSVHLTGVGPFGRAPLGCHIPADPITAAVLGDLPSSPGVHAAGE